jgi:hypothetical protein
MIQWCLGYSLPVWPPTAPFSLPKYSPTIGFGWAVNLGPEAAGWTAVVLSTAVIVTLVQ